MMTQTTKKTFVLSLSYDQTSQLLKQCPVGTRPVAQTSTWITFDPQSELELSKKNINLIPASALCGSFLDRIQTNSWTASRLGSSWFKNIPVNLDIGTHVEDFWMRDWTYTFRSMLKAFYLLEEIYRREGPQEIWTIRPFFPPSQFRPIREACSENLFPSLLTHFKSRWNWNVHFIEKKMPPSILPRKTSQ